MTICAVPGATVTTADLWSTGVGNDCGVPEAIPVGSTDWLPRVIRLASSDANPSGAELCGVT